jgi:hypothetical protein
MSLSTFRGGVRRFQTVMDKQAVGLEAPHVLVDGLHRVGVVLVDGVAAGIRQAMESMRPTSKRS